VVNYTDIRSTLNTGDVFTFGGNAPLDFMIEFAEGGYKYSHVGMVINNGGNLYFWDAPGEGSVFPDPYFPNRTPTPGCCRVANLDDILAYYMSAMETNFFTMRQLAPGSLNADSLQSLDLFIKMVDGTPFPSITPPQFLVDLLKYLDPTLPIGSVDLGTGLGVSYALGCATKLNMPGYYFCAQLIADTYMHMGLLPYAPWPPNSYAPATFDLTDPTKLPLIAPAALGPVTQVNYNVTPPPPPNDATAKS
jgi:hypothetical protein